MAFSQGSDSQYGKIVGKVVDAETGETIIGANVVISGTSQGDATDIDGKYSIDKVQPGIYSLTTSYISYTRKTLTGIEVEVGEVVTVNIKLSPETLGLEEVIVSA
ncbi:MAG TPA: carboxypeptidase-like regulatory domain-containing protein, partial [Halalkalibaculum sp.]|nr:carboxypeptidase-like regulatory domain-containing protein [Halalkalibaculum sp.]